MPPEISNGFSVLLLYKNIGRCLSETLFLTPREVEVFDKLIHSEESIQEIADSLFLSRRTCQRYIASIYKKAGVKSRMGLYQLYTEKQRRQ